MDTNELNAQLAQEAQKKNGVMKKSGTGLGIAAILKLTASLTGCEMDAPHEKQPEPPITGPYIPTPPITGPGYGDNGGTEPGPGPGPEPKPPVNGPGYGNGKDNGYWTDGPGPQPPVYAPTADPLPTIEFPVIGPWTMGINEKILTAISQMHDKSENIQARFAGWAANNTLSPAQRIFANEMDWQQELNGRAFRNATTTTALSQGLGGQMGDMFRALHPLIPNQDNINLLNALREAFGTAITLDQRDPTHNFMAINNARTRLVNQIANVAHFGGPQIPNDPSNPQIAVDALRDALDAIVRAAGDAGPYRLDIIKGVALVRLIPRPSGAVPLGVRGICSPVNVNLSRINLQYRRALLCGCLFNN